MSRTVVLTATKVAFIGNERELDKQPEQKTVEVTAVFWAKLVAAAELGGFRPTKGYLPAGKCAEFSGCVRNTLGKDRTSSTRASHRTPADFINEFFAAPANRRLLKQVLALVDEGHGLSVES